DSQSQKFSRRRCIRTIFTTSLVALLSGSLSRQTGAQGNNLDSEIEVSDPGPDVRPEALSFDRAASEAPLAIESRGPKKDSRAFALKMLDISGQYADENVDRQRTPDQVAEFLGLFELPFQYQTNGPYVPFCAAGVSFAACKAYSAIQPETAV